MLVNFKEGTGPSQEKSKRSNADKKNRRKAERIQQFAVTRDKVVNTGHSGRGVVIKKEGLKYHAKKKGSDNLQRGGESAET